MGDALLASFRFGNKQKPARTHDEGAVLILQYGAGIPGVGETLIDRVAACRGKFAGAWGKQVARYQADFCRHVAG